MKNTTFPKNNVLAGIVVLAAALSFATGARAEDAPNPFMNLKQSQKQVTSFEKADPNGRIDFRSIDVDFTMGRASTLLALTPDQQTTVRTVLADQNKRVDAAEHDTSLTATARDNRIEAIYRDAETRIHSTLTTDQLLKAKVLEAQGIVDPDTIRMGKLYTFDSRLAALPVVEAVSQWGATLNLTATQRLALIPVVQAENRQLDAIATDKTLSPDDSRIRAQDVMVTTERKIDDLLTTPQKQYVQDALIFGYAPDGTNPRNSRPAAH
jgi:hypothetical protein